MEPEAIRRVIDIWVAQEAELGARKDITYVQIFENRGAIMGTSNPHPHGQIWATEHIPNEPARELAAQTEHFRRYGKPLLQAYLDLELRQAERIVIEREHWIALVPFWAVWPFELLLLPRNTVATLNSLATPLRDDLSVILKKDYGGLRSCFRHSISLLDGVSCCTLRRRSAPGVAPSCSFLSATSTFRIGA